MRYYQVLLKEKYCLSVGPLTYLSAMEIIPGTLVKVPFRNKEVAGLLIEEVAPFEAKGYELKEIVSIHDHLLSPAQMSLVKWLADYYAVPLQKAVLVCLPGELWKGTKELRITNYELRIGEKEHVLTGVQREIVEGILQGGSATWLLHGVTGSGKTEIYLQVAKEVLRQGKQVIILVPEIALTPQTSKRFEERFPGQVAILHSGVTVSQKKKLYQEIRERKKNVVLGARSALFAPAHALGLIIIDEEHEQSYHQDQSPRYHAVTVARKLQELTDSILILGSATPSLTSYQDQEQKVVLLPERVHGGFPDIELIDMRNELKAKNYSPLSERLQEAIGEELAQKRQVLLFLNRRGFASTYLCRECGFREMCPHCEISLTVHLSNYHGGFDPEAKLICHYCGFTKQPPSSCPRCSSVALKALGSGTQKIIMELERLFPHARTVRVDADTMTSAASYHEFYQDFLDHKYDIVLGTQMIAKGLHLPKVQLVGVILADLSFHFPEYTAQEKTFQLLTQVSGRAGRMGEKGRVYIQTYDPSYAVLRHVVNHDYAGFRAEELGFRQEYWYPPFCDILRLTVYEKTNQEAKKEAGQLKDLLSREKVARNLIFELLGPTPAWLHRRVGKFGYHLILKVPKGEDILSQLVTFMPKNVMIDRE
ncbi:MAG: primosomal protein N' [Candidatus Abawacabacteria bacterium]|nr:primosomal protein N' [Candidatus Abawacabacteria bacterium]